MSRLKRDGFKVFHLRIVQAGRNEQNAIGAHGAGFIHLIRIHHEIFAQHRQVADWPWLALNNRRCPEKTAASVNTDKQAAPCSA
jgi:hypothetical protein